MQGYARVEHATPPQPTTRGAVEDLRFRKLLSDADWQALPAAVRRRFSKRVGPGDAVIYTGRIVETDIPAAGRVLAVLLKVIGAPLPLSRATNVAAVVTVTEDRDAGGQVWTRLYTRRQGLPQVIQSAKRFAGPTGLEEHIGFGVFMRLDVRAVADGLIFEGTSYHWRIAGLTIRLPRWLEPGRLVVGHHDLGDGTFAFTLDLGHPWFGRLIHQRGIFADAA